MPNKIRKCRWKIDASEAMYWIKQDLLYWSDQKHSSGWWNYHRLGYWNCILTVKKPKILEQCFIYVLTLRWSRWGRGGHYNSVTGDYLRAFYYPFIWIWLRPWCKDDDGNLQFKVREFLFRKRSQFAWWVLCRRSWGLDYSRCWLYWINRENRGKGSIRKC